MTALRFLEALPVGLRKATVDDVRQALGNLTATCSAGTRPRPSWCARFSGQWRRRERAQLVGFAMFKLGPAQTTMRRRGMWHPAATASPAPAFFISREWPISTPPH